MALSLETRNASAKAKALLPNKTTTRLKLIIAQMKIVKLLLHKWFQKAMAGMVIFRLLRKRKWCVMIPATATWFVAAASKKIGAEGAPTYAS